MRNLVVACYGVLPADFADSLDHNKWCVTYVQSDADLASLEQRQDVFVGLAIFSAPHDTAALHLIQRAVFVLPDAKWIGTMAKECLSDAVIKRFIAKRLYDFQTFPLNRERLAMALGHAYGMATIEHELQGIADKSWPARLGLIGDSPVMQELFRLIRRGADSDVPVLITGPTGSGKEKTARAIHDLSVRSRGPFVALNCAAIPPALIYSELFGHVKGAFTDALTRKFGHIELASGGTLFLDEIGDMPLESQGVLLRFIEEQLVTPLGSTQSSLVDVRLVAATNMDLHAAIIDRQFRADLFYRLAVCIVRTPSLRSREGDIELLAKHYLDEAIATFGGTRDSSFSSAALAAIYQYPWPGNLRELRSTVFQAVIDCRSRQIDVGDLKLGGGPQHADAQVRKDRGSLQDTRQLSEKHRLVASLALNGSNIARTARELGISRMTLYRLMNKHGVSRGAGH